VAAAGLLLSPGVWAQEGAGGDSIACFVRAHRVAFLTDNQSLRLCLGARSEAPALCYEQARSVLFLTDETAIHLCRCATSAEPVRCFALARAQTGLLDTSILPLCSPTFVYGLLENCQPAWPGQVPPANAPP
jgi:hypothetical protein